MNIFDQVKRQIDRDFPISHKQRSKPQEPLTPKTTREHIRPRWMAEEGTPTLGQLLRELMEESK